MSSAVPSAGPSPTVSAPSAQTKRIRISSHRQIFAPVQGLYQFFGEVMAEMPGITITAGELTYDAKRELATASGTVSVTENGQTYQGQSLEYSVKTRTWRFREWETTLSPASLGEPFTEPVYLSSEEAGIKGRALCMEHTQVTTCDLQDPHYALIADEVEIYPGKRLIARDVHLYVLGKKIITLPWFFLPLTDEQPAVWPEVGQNEVEGYYARIPYQYVFGEGQLGMLRLDLTQKRGIGLGVNHWYAVDGGHGKALLYGSQGSGDYTVQLKHQHQLPLDIAADLSLDRKRSTISSSLPTTTTNALANFSRATEHTSTRFNLAYYDSDSVYHRERTSAVLRHEINAGKNAISYTGNYNTMRLRGVTDQPADEDLWHHLLWTHRLAVGDIKMRVDQHSDPDGEAFTGDNNVTGLQRLPEITFETDAARLGIDAMKHVPSRLAVGWGWYSEQVSQDPVGRFALDLQASPHPMSLGSTAITANAWVKQTIYDDSDMSAQYVADAGLTATTLAGSFTNTVRYNLRKSEGFTPLRTDVAYPYHSISNSLQYNTPALKVTLTGGRDLHWHRWQDVSLNAEVRPLEELTMRHSLGYDLNNGRWRDLSSRFTWQGDDKMAVSLNTRYDMERSQLRTVSTDVEWTISPQWRVQWQGGYDGINTRFYANKWLLTRDLHCWEASLYADLTNETFGLNLHPKAFGNMTLPHFSFGRGSGQLQAGMGFNF